MNGNKVIEEKIRNLFVFSIVVLEVTRFDVCLFVEILVMRGEMRNLLFLVFVVGLRTL